uniref:Uncharacterized protein n=1 Tax=virus sp. ctBM815 TaxID=2825806 RepID=A0A8S5RK00_9VIRU|nr:MAG TPA: hypothetical protein [virus sp. ctBM815]
MLIKYSPLKNYVYPSKGIVYTEVNLPIASLKAIYCLSLKTLNTSSLFLLS